MPLRPHVLQVRRQDMFPKMPSGARPLEPHAPATAHHRENHPRQAKQEPRICLLGNLDQVDFLKTATPAEVDARTRETLRLGKPGGRYIFSTSDYLEIGTPRENVVAMIEAARDEGRY